MKTLLLIDANSLIHRAFHALPLLTAHDGSPTQALYGVASILLKLWREGRPDYVAALFDRPEPTFRKQEYAEYKAQRPKAPDELVSQIIEAHELFSKFGIQVFETPGFEADDLIASFAERFRSEPQLRIVILTGDLDTLQLVGGNVVVRALRKGVSDVMTYDSAAVYERYGLSPSQLIDYKALVGDQSDNIRGMPGVGPKTAQELLQKNGTIEAFYKHIDAPENRRVARLLARERDRVSLSQRLVTLDRHAPLDIAALETLAVRDEEAPLKDYFKELGFETLINRMSGKKEDKKPLSRRAAAETNNQGKMF